MAGEQEEDDDASSKTEAATQKRIQRALDDGQAPLSREAVGFATLLLSVVACLMLLPGTLSDTLALLRGVLGRSHEIEAFPAARAFLFASLDALWPIMACACVGAIGATFAQTRRAWAPKLLKPQLSRIGPIAGLKRKFGAEGWIEFLRSLVKIIVVGVALWWVAWDPTGLAMSMQFSGGALLAAAGDGMRALLLATLGVFLVLTVLDVVLVRFRWLEQLRMSRRDLRDEMKESEGDPLMRARQRMIRETRGRQRMLAAVPSATVVITNPTHYAVALRYDPDSSAAPRVVAKGADAVAARIREAASEAGVPLHSDPPLARALYRLDVDTDIPPEHWEAVAQIIAFVLRSRGALPGGPPG
jgi:flagellar biosynthesis protein FlhB